MARRENSGLNAIRHAYAKQLLAAAGLRNARVERAFAATPREKFLGRGPWPILRWGKGYVRSPSADPSYVYTDVLVGLQTKKHINNGQPSFHALLLAKLDPQPGEHVVHVGAGSGYYTAVMAELVGKTGRVTAFEVDKEMVARAKRNLRRYPQVRVIHGDATRMAFDPADGIYVNAGVTRPPEAWLDALRGRGRMIVPLTTEGGFNRRNAGRIERHGAVFRIERRRQRYLATWLSPVAIYPCKGARDKASERALRQAFKKGGWQSVRRLYRHDDVPAARCWLKGDGWCLAYA
ncbi:MAG TPA: methyltransferase domain-containing protein [Dongiaceae bacterium]|jgi:protein-L-isoaspartate(D-aspartate) O-methyltransferase|nr:methyltransferase domain-containing protein [Dongiaceae bacterium]